jgi:hypothetical protein
MREWWERRFLGAELVLAALVVAGLALLDAVVLDRAFQGVLQMADRPALWATLAGIAGGLLGFVLASASIILGLVSSRKSWRIRISDQLQVIWRVYISTTRWLGALTVSSLLLLIVDTGNRAHPLVLAAIGFLVMVSVARLLRCIWILDQLLHLQTAESSN